MYTQDSPEFYLHRDFNKNYSKSGTPFLSADCFDGCNNLIIYGHHMKNKTMFEPLLNYRKEDFYKKHQYIRFITLNDDSNYQIIAVFKSKVYKEKEKGFKYYEYFDLRNPKDYDEYILNIKNKSLYHTDEETINGNSLITLSTCSYQTENERFVVVAQKI